MQVKPILGVFKMQKYFKSLFPSDVAEYTETEGAFARNVRNVLIGQLSFVYLMPV